jgi:dolichol kinase
MTYWEELGRKSIHLGSAVFPLIYHYTDKTFMLWLMIPLVVFAITIETLRQFFPGVQSIVQRTLGPILRVEEKSLFTGATYVAIAILLSVLLFPKPIAICALLFLSISDALASLIGIKFGKARFLGKSVAGSGAFLLSAIAIALWQLPPHAWLVGIAGAVVATITEALSMKYGQFKIDDNLAIPLVSGGAIVGLMVMGLG